MDDGSAGWWRGRMMVLGNEYMGGWRHWRMAAELQDGGLQQGPRKPAEKKPGGRPERKLET